MQWTKLGQIFTPDTAKPWSRSHAMVPTPARCPDDPDLIRFYYTGCDENMMGRLGWVDYKRADLQKPVRQSAEPVLDIGRPGTFDENGVLTTCIYDREDGSSIAYYVGFELGHKIRYRLMTGAAIREAGSEEFKRVSEAPILDRCDEELYFRGGPWVIKDGDQFRMWYVSGNNWLTKEDGRQLPVYELRHITSQDGLHWPGKGQTSLPISNENEHGFGRPFVIKKEDGYTIFYSVRRKDLDAYRIGYGTSKDGMTWQRHDADIGIDVSDQGWDSEVVCYASPFTINDQTYMVYNGNGFGRDGFGLARLDVA